MPLNQRGVLSLFQRFILEHFSVLSPFQRFILISAFYPHFSVLSPFQRFILISAFYPHFSFRFQFQFPPFSFSVLSQPLGHTRRNCTFSPCQPAISCGILSKHSREKSERAKAINVVDCW